MAREIWSRLGPAFCMPENARHGDMRARAPPNLQTAPNSL
jgi:hypothetical protein